ncbi:MAG: flagellar filament capping protein FliD [Veillonellaceae bacterium]|nr:flagellar filament capping protein FliD [Veillonellaceae bacterium]
MVMRTYGLSGSGIDVDQMVKDLMKARRASYDKVWQQKTQLEWKKKDYNTIYTLTQDLRNNTIFDFRKSASLQPKQVTSTNDAVVSATANADAANVSHSIIVEQLADGVKLSSTGSITTGTSKDTLVNQFGYNAADNTELNFVVNGKNVNITITDQTTIYDVVSGLNNAGADIKANYDATLDRFYIYSNKTGESAKVDFTGSNSDALEFITDKLKINPNSDGDLVFTGKNAIVEIDGVKLERESNSFQVSGVSYNLKAESYKDPNTGVRTATTININADIEKTIANVKAFVDTYNTYMSALNTELNETKYRDFMPLTDAQKADMKEADIKAWEEKAKSGMLRRDSLLSEIVSSARLNFTNPIEGLTGKYKTASSIGINTGSYVDEDGKLTSDASNGGKLYVDETKLRKALEEDPEIVAKIFGNSGDTAAKQGIANRLYDQLNNSMKKIKDTAGYPNATDTTSSLAKQLEDYDDRLYAMNDRLTQIENRYYKQFDAMEAALNRMNQQSMWLLQQFSS